MENKKKILKEYHFEFKHLIVILIALIFFQIIVSFIYKTSLQSLLINTQEWYQRDSAEKLANLTSTSLELILATTAIHHSQEESEKVIQAFNIILSQQLLQQNVEEICIVVSNGSDFYAIDNGTVLYSYFFNDSLIKSKENVDHSYCLQIYKNVQNQLVENERTFSFNEGNQTFHVFVPFVPKGEYAGAVYMKITPDFSIITREIISSYDEVTLIFAALIFLGLLAMFYISSYTVKERNEAQQLLFDEREEHLKEQINHDKETQFTKRIYHTHHKAEKIMGYIKEDLRSLSEKNIEDVKYRVTKYANFISRVIYDMKWYDPPLQSIRNQIFQTDINSVIEFIVDNIFNRVVSKSNEYNFKLDLDRKLPKVSINEFVVWELIEPLLQNSIDHAGVENIEIKIQTKFYRELKIGKIFIEDNGKGIPESLMHENESGIKKIFLENISTKSESDHSGYGCYLAYDIAKQKCNWDLNVENLQNIGCKFIITIPNLT